MAKKAKFAHLMDHNCIRDIWKGLHYTKLILRCDQNNSSSRKIMIKDDSNIGRS